MLLHITQQELRQNIIQNLHSQKTPHDTPYLALMGKLWGVLCEDLGENLPRYNGITLYVSIGSGNL